LAGTYTLVEFTFVPPGAKESVIYGPPMYEGTITFTWDGKYTEDLKLAGTAHTESGTFTLEKDGWSDEYCWLTLHPGAAGTMRLGTADLDGESVSYPSPLRDKFGDMHFHRRNTNTVTMQPNQAL
jgi:hypothetical protein